MQKLTLLSVFLYAFYCVSALASSDKSEKPHRACSLLKIGVSGVVTCAAAYAAQDSFWYAGRGIADVVTGQTYPNCNTNPHVRFCEISCRDTYTCWTTQYSKNSGGNIDNIPLHSMWSAITTGVGLYAVNIGMNAVKDLK